MLDEVKEGIMNAYEIKTGMDRKKISHLMDAESWFNAKKSRGAWLCGRHPAREGRYGRRCRGLMFSRTAVHKLPADQADSEKAGGKSTHRAVREAFTVIITLNLWREML